MRLIIEVKNPTEELTGHILFTLVVGYFAYAQYDVLFFYLSLRQCRASKLACKGLRTTVFMKR